MLRRKDTGEVHHIRIYADYWIINKTGLRLIYQHVREVGEMVFRISFNRHLRIGQSI